MQKATARYVDGHNTRVLSRSVYRAVHSKSGRLGGHPGYIKPGITGPRPRFGGVRPGLPVQAPPAVHPEYALGHAAGLRGTPSNRLRTPPDGTAEDVRQFMAGYEQGKAERRAARKAAGK